MTNGAVSSSFFLDIYGYIVEIRTSCEEARDGLSKDFGFFQAPPRQGARLIELLEMEPPYASLPALTGSVYTPRNVSYRDQTFTYIDYSGRALGVHDRVRGDFRVYSKDPGLLYETAYLFLLSQGGEHCDSRGLHRVHALAVAINGKAALAMLPMGGGKSTLAWKLLEFSDIEFLSDDSPFIDKKGRIHAFPLRLGLLPDALAGVPTQHVRRIDRMEFGVKYLVNYDYLAPRVRPTAEPCILFIGRRSLSGGCEITPASWWSAVWSMMSNCVVGLGLFQGMEFVFQRSSAELVAKAGIAWRRLLASLALIRHSRVFYLTLGRDSAANARAVHDFLAANATRCEAAPKNSSAQPTAFGARE